MSVKPRTIDNLGVDSSIRYAKDQELLKDVRLIEESRWIPQKSEVSVTKPYVSSEFDKLFTSNRTASWALFAPPQGYDAMARALFSYQMIPSLGAPEKSETDEKLAALEDALKKKQKRDKRHQSSEDEEEEQQERETLSALLHCIEKFDKTLFLINARRNQYQRG
jgi:hypothetical protein